MKIEKAIEILDELRDHSASQGEADALSLGIEALKWRKRFVDALPDRTFGELPGETEE